MRGSTFAVTGLDLNGKRVLCDNRPPVLLELLSINTGSTPNTSLVPRDRQRRAGQTDHRL